MGRRLYGLLLAAFPRLETLDGSWEARFTNGDRLRLEVTGRRGSFRRIELLQFEEDELGDLVCAPRLELLVDINTQCLHIAQYEHTILCPKPFTANSVHCTEGAPRLVIALVTEFLNSLAGTNILLLADREFRSKL